MLYQYNGKYFELIKTYGDTVGRFYCLEENKEKIYKWFPMGYLPVTCVSIEILKHPIC